MRKKRQLEPSRLTGLVGFHAFDQGNGLGRAADEGLYRDEEHTSAPEYSQRVSFRI